MKILLIVYDNGSYVHTFPHGIAYIAAVLEKEGYKVEIYNQDVHHYSEEHLTEYLNKNIYDAVGLSFIAGYYQYQKVLKISDAINKSKTRKRFLYIIGGHGPSPEPEYFLEKTMADCVVIGEGEQTILHLIDALRNVLGYSHVKGIVWRAGLEFYHNEKRELIKDVDSIPFPAYHLFPMEYYRLFRCQNINRTDFVMTMLSGRGCNFKCTFCYRMDEGFRPRSPQSIIDEIKLLKTNYGINVIDFSDELLMSSTARTTELCEAFIKAELNIKWNCNGRLNFAKPQLLELMKRAGCTFINYGIEALDNEVLKNMKKGLTVDIIEEGVRNTLKASISPGINIMFGNIGDTKEILERDVEFLLKYDDCSQLRTIRFVTPYPGSELYYYAIKKGLLKDVEDFYENKHKNSDLLTVNFTNMNTEQMHKSLLRANNKLIYNYLKKKADKLFKESIDLYINKNKNFRGFRQF